MASQFERSFADRSTLLLIGSNLLAWLFAVAEGWSLGSLLGVYWIQSVIIGFFQVFKILDLRNFTTKGFTQNGKSVPPTRASQISTALFFTLHYGIFHLVYIMILLGRFRLVEVGGRALLLGGLVFFGNHLYSYLHHRERDRERPKNLGKVFFFPYARIIPMHIILVTGAFLAKNALAVTLFLLLKTGADVVMHKAEHRLGDGPRRRSPYQG